MFHFFKKPGNFSGTIAENIKLGSFSSDSAEIKKYFRAAKSSKKFKVFQREFILRY